jgi:hypothetical protein
VNEGAAVRVSLLGFGALSGGDGKRAGWPGFEVVSAIHADLTGWRRENLTRPDVGKKMPTALSRHAKTGPFDMLG